MIQEILWYDEIICKLQNSVRINVQHLLTIK